MLHKHTNLIQWIALIILVLGVVLLIFDSADAAGDSPQPLFDHSLCQYPDRTTNPVDGCDNTDACDPAQLKDGSGDCVTPPVSQIPMSQNVTTVEKPVESVHKSCE